MRQTNVHGLGSQAVENSNNHKAKDFYEPQAEYNVQVLLTEEAQLTT